MHWSRLNKGRWLGAFFRITLLLITQRPFIIINFRPRYYLNHRSIRQLSQWGCALPHRNIVTSKHHAFLFPRLNFGKETKPWDYARSFARLQMTLWSKWTLRYPRDARAKEELPEFALRPHRSELWHRCKQSWISGSSQTFHGVRDQMGIAVRTQGSRPALGANRS